MKRVLVIVVATIFGLVQGCMDRGNKDLLVNAENDASGNVSLAFTNPPPEVARVVATLSRSGHDPRILDLVLSDSTQSAAGGFEEVAVGVWQLLVEALDDSNTIRYAGATSVEVRPGQVSHISLHLLPTSGGIEIVVTWGPPPSPTGGLMAYYPFNGNANDVSGNGNNGMVSGATLTADRHGNPNSAYRFDGSNDMISIPSSPSLHPNDQFTIAFWIRLDGAINNWLSIVHKGGPIQPGYSNREYSIYAKRIQPTQYSFYTFSAGDGSGQHEIPSPALTNLNEWVFVATVIDRRNHWMRAYLDGNVGEVPDSYSSFTPNDFPLTIGMEAETGWPDHSPLYGAIDEVRLYNRALTSAEIQALREMR
ncbi:MAG: LamG domain-containing protein [Bacteroidota bacterium]